MPIQGSWVELWLGRYCRPGHHRFRPLRTDVVVCEYCRKEELVGGATCLVCGIPGERQSTIETVGDHVERITGRLCGPCHDEFNDRTEISGWRLVA